MEDLNSVSAEDHLARISASVSNSIFPWGWQDLWKVSINIRIWYCGSNQDQHHLVCWPPSEAFLCFQQQQMLLLFISRIKCLKVPLWFQSYKAQKLWKVDESTFTKSLGALCRPSPSCSFLIFFRGAGGIFLHYFA